MITKKRGTTVYMDRESLEDCRHDSQDGFFTGIASGWLCLQCERVVVWHAEDAK